MKDRFGNKLEVGDYVAHATVSGSRVCLLNRQIIAIINDDVGACLHLDGSSKPGRVMPYNCVKSFNQY